MDNQQKIWRPKFFERDKKKKFFWIFLVIFSGILSFVLPVAIYLFLLFLFITVLQYIGYILPQIKIYKEGLWLRKKHVLLNWEEIEKISLHSYGVINETQMFSLEIITKEKTHSVVLDYDNIQEFKEIIKKLGYEEKLQ